MTGTITWGFTHLVKSRHGEKITAKCGLTIAHPGWLDQGTKCPDCYGITYPPSAGSTGPINYGRNRS